MPRPRSSSSRRRGPVGPSKVEQRRAAAAAFEPVLAVAEPLATRASQDLGLTVPQGYPWFDRSDREFALHLAPGWSWSVRVRYRDEDEAQMQLAADAAGVEETRPLATGDPVLMEREISAHLTQFLQTARTRNLASATEDGA